MRLKLLALAIPLASLPLYSHGEDLLDAWHQARTHDPVLTQADAQRLATRENIDQARAALLPQVSIGIGFKQFSNRESTFDAGAGVNPPGHVRERSLSATLNQSVIDLGKIASLHAASASANAQDARYAEAEQALYVRVTKAYFNVLTAQDKLTYAKASEDAYRQQYEQTQQRFRVALSAITDVYQARSYYENARAQTLTAQNQLDDAREALTQITGTPVNHLKKLRDTLPLDAPVPASPQPWIKKALQNSPTVLANQYSLLAAGKHIRAARARYFPKLEASVSYGKDTSWLQHSPVAPFPGNGRYRTTVGLTLTIPIFYGGATSSLVRQSIHQRDAARAALERARRQVRRDILHYYRSTLAGIRQVQSGKAAVTYAKKALDATRTGFRVGTKTVTDVLLAIQTLSKSKSNYTQNRHQLIVDKLQLEQTSGTAGLHNLKKINALLY